jgi:hypothetical protein
MGKKKKLLQISWDDELKKQTFETLENFRRENQIEISFSAWVRRLLRQGLAAEMGQQG